LISRIPHTLLFPILLFFTFHVRAQVFDNAAEAFKISEESGKPVFLVFSGSDWCAPCIQFEKKILTESTFVQFASERLIILKADFPQRKRLTKEMEKQNDTLADRYNPQGIFPYLLLIKPDGSLSGILNYVNQAPSEFMAEIAAHLSTIKNGPQH
jgi:thiol-disulfide isomerase/thioredoxin